MEDDQEILEEFIDQVFKDANAYKTNFKTILEEIKKNKDDFLKTSLDCIKLILSSYEPGNPFDESKQKHLPETHLQALRATKDLMEIKSEEINLLIAEMILPYFKNIALFTKEKDEQKFKKESYFGNKEKFSSFSNSFVILTLESIKMWSSWYPNSIFSSQYEDLIRKNVNFPKKFIYYREEDYIESNMKNDSMIEDSIIKLSFEIENELHNFEQETNLLKIELAKNDVSLISKQLENSKLKISEMKIKMINFKDQLTKSRDLDSQAKYLNTLSKEIDLAETILSLKEFYNKNDIDSNQFMEALFEILNLNNPNLAASKTNKPASNIFPSSPEQEILNDVLQDVANYGKNRKEYIKKLIELDREKMEEILTFLKSILVTDSYSPINKVLALRFLKECVDAKSPLIISFIENNILDLLFSISSFRIEDASNDKGKHFFSKNPNEKNEELEKLSLTFYLQALECILIWARWFPHEKRKPTRKSKFLLIYEELVKMGCIFPNALRFFSDDDFSFEMLVQNMEDFFNKLQNLLLPNESQVNKKNLLQLMKDITNFLNLKKNEQFFLKIGSMQQPSKIQMFQRLDHDFSILKMAIVSYDKMNKKEIKYLDFHSSIIKEINSPLSLLAVEEKLELINVAEEDFEEPSSNEKNKKKENSSYLRVEKADRIVLNPELEEKMNTFIKDVLIKQEEYESNAIFYLVNFDMKKEEVLYGLELVLESHEYNYTQKFFSLLFLKQIMDERIYFLELDKIFSAKILNCLIMAQKLAKEMNPPPFTIQFIDLANECFLVWNYWAEQDYKENKESLIITKILSEHFPHGISTEKGNEFYYFDNNENQYNCCFCLFFKDSEHYMDVLANYLQKFDNFINSIKEFESNLKIEHKLKNFFLGFEDITNHHTQLSDSGQKFEKYLDIFLHESQTYQDYIEKKISFHEFIELLKRNLNNHEESPEVSEFKRELESPQKYDVHEEIDLDNEKAIKNLIVSSQYKNSQEVFNPKASNPYSSQIDDMDENLEYSPVKNVILPSSTFQIVPPPLHEKPKSKDSESPKQNESLKLIDSLTLQNRSLEHQLRDEKNKVDSMREENTSLLREMNKIQIELKEEKRNNNLLNELLTQADTNNKNAKRDCEKYIKDIINLREEIEKKNIENEKIRNENVFLKNLIEENERNFNSERENLAKATPIVPLKEEYVDLPSNIEKILETTAKKETGEKIFEPMNDHNFYNEEDDEEDNPNTGAFLENEKEISPLDRQMLFPFKSPIDYFTNKSTKEYKGKLADYNRALFKNVLNLRIDTHRFKIACLKKKSVLFKNDHLQIGIVTANQISKDKNFLRLNIFFTNKSEFKITDLDFDFHENETLTIYCKNDNFQNVLQPGVQTKIEIIIENNSVPFEILLTEIKYKAEGSYKSIKLPLPSTFNLFMRWAEVTPLQFKSKWKEIAHQKTFKICKTKVVPLNKKIAKSINDIKEFFPFLFDLKPTLQNDFLTKISSYSLGGLFCFSDVEQEFLMKLTLNPDDSFIIRVISLKENENQMQMKEFLLQNFLFLLEENED